MVGGEQVRGIFAQLEQRAAEDDPAALRDLALVELIYGCALRVSEACGADVDDLDPGRQRPPGVPARHLDAEPVVGEEDVADARDQNSLLGKDLVHAGSISSGWK